MACVKWKGGGACVNDGNCVLEPVGRLAKINKYDNDNERKFPNNDSGRNGRTHGKNKSISPKIK